MRSYIRYSRIAAATFCGIACLLLIVFWARSYVTSDQLTGPISKSKRLFVGSLAGAVQIRVDDRKWSDPDSLRRWTINTTSVAELNKSFDHLREMQAKLGSQQAPTRINMTMYIGWKHDTLFLPYWLLVLLTGAPAVVVGLCYGDVRQE